MKREMGLNKHVALNFVSIAFDRIEIDRNGERENTFDSIRFVSIAEVAQVRISTSPFNRLSSDASSSHLGRVVP
jgi:hypothetical protein